YYPNVVDFIVSMVSRDNKLLDMDKLYFQFLVDGEPFEFTPAMDPGLDAPASLIKFGTNDFISFVAREQIVQLVAIPPTVNYEVLALRLVYDPAGTTPVYSDAVTVATGNGIDHVGADSAGLISGYMDLQGRSLTDAPRGLSIRKISMPDGSVKYQKTIHK
ncbi:MAG: hypothetical protein K2F87_06435, partial [Muribaculaceae bacterium]|nr:hypothetical protein [Muribaculaceae bacterium]